MTMSVIKGESMAHGMVQSSWPAGGMQVVDNAHTAQGNMCITGGQAADLERRIANNILQRLFTPTASNYIRTLLYSQGGAPHRGVYGGASEWNEAAQPTPEPENAWCRLEVQGLKLQHFAKDPLPPFRIVVRQLNGDPLPRTTQADGTLKPMVDMRVRFSLSNKWATVTSEVLLDAQLEYTLVDGVCDVPGLVFHEVSVKHGGHFTLKVLPIDFAGEVLPWKSPKLKIQSVKTHCLRKRKMHATAAALKMQAEANKKQRVVEGAGPLSMDDPAVAIVAAMPTANPMSKEEEAALPQAPPTRSSTHA